MPSFVFTSLASFSGIEVKAKRRCGVIVRLNGVRGAAVGGRAGGLSTSLPPRSRWRSASPSGPGSGWATMSAMARRPPLPVVAASSRSMRTLSRTSFSGRRRYSMAVRCRSSGVGRHVLGLPRRLVARRPVVGVLVEEDREHLGAGRAVDRGVVDLGQLGDVAVLQALDDVQLPQRACAVERPG